MQPFGLRLMKLAPWQPPAHVNTTDSRRQIYSKAKRLFNALILKFFEGTRAVIPIFDNCKVLFSKRHNLRSSQLEFGVARCDTNCTVPRSR
jgi:hypothetical protein